MDNKIGLFWLRDDFRVTKNYGLIEATRNHEKVVVFYLYKNETYIHQEAQKWWLSKSLTNFQKKLSDLNINLEIIKTSSFKIFFEKLKKKQDFKIYWNKVYEPDYLKFTIIYQIVYLKKILPKYSKEMLLMKLMKLKKHGTHLRCLRLL